MFFRSNAFSVADLKEDECQNVSFQPFLPSGKRIRAVPQEWTYSFGIPFYIHELSLSALAEQSEQDWKLRMEGQLFETGKKINVTPFAELRDYIRQELSSITILETEHVHE